MHTQDIDHDHIALWVYKITQETKGVESEHLSHGIFQPVLNPQIEKTEKFVFAWCPDPDSCNGG